MKEIKIDGIEYVKKENQTTKTKLMNGLEYCIVRTYSAGVFAGYYDRKIKGQEGIVFNARRLWRWQGSATLSQFAKNGTSKPNECQFPCEVDEIDLKQIIEVIPCSEKAKKSIDSVPVWSE